MTDKLALAGRILLICLYCLAPAITHASIDPSVLRLKLAYPGHVKDIRSNYIVWHDGSHMQVGNSNALVSFFKGRKQVNGKPTEVISDKDIVHARFEPFFKKMYGNTPREVGKKLVTIYWMQHVFGKRYPLRVTTVNGVDQKLRRISNNLEKLPRSYYKYLENPGGSFYWRKVKGESALSAHSFGIALDINLRYSNYWLWDYQKTHKPLSELRNQQLTCPNRIPMEIVEIFEKEGFFWGGRWYFYDTMHFEYRPDLLVT